MLTRTQRAEARRIELDRKIAKAPIHEIVGVIDASGSGGSKWHDDRQWRFVASLCAWRCDDGPVRTQPLRVERWIAESALAAANRRWPAWAVFRCRARLLEQTAGSGPRALAIRVLPAKGRDADLDAARKSLQKPVHRRVPGLGRFTLDRRIDLWTGRPKWNRSKITLCVQGDPSHYPESQIRKARGVLSKAGMWDSRLKRRATDAFLTLKNKSWLGDAETPISAQQFQQRLSLENWTLRADGSMEFSFDDGDLFWGHEIVVPVDAKGRLGKPQLQG